MPPEAYISHQTTGRVRIKVPSRKRDAGYFGRLQNEFTRLHGIQNVEVNPTTGSVLLATAEPTWEIAAFAKEEDLFLLAPPHGGALYGRVLDAFRSLNAGTLNLSSGELDISSLIFLTLVGTGIYQLSVGNVTTPPWYTAFWYALGVMSKSIGGKGSGASNAAVI
jgi:hypothetical protein